MATITNSAFSNWIGKYNKMREYIYDIDMDYKDKTVISPSTGQSVVVNFKRTFRIKLATTHKDLGKIYQQNFAYERDKIPERNKGRKNGTILLKKAGGLAKNMVHVWLVVKG
jgi:hypothetical protein